ncbi:hypothetical protein EN45_112880 [Penicillium chrysogenum]|uniref:Apple domain-containing protein n=2 Tax=Penicillium chrysogenum species complex TaxID=254878 RepID=B6H3K9_PENRW|nr:hypothetical protein EN45_112880 [Penicillium chrysogenum]CAP92408.1 hypothetical protein PCH_Pc13g13390 [Penicillium rubens Wisconsin 54-1255]
MKIATMKITPFWVSIALLVPQALAASATSTTSTAAAPTCTSSLITSLCGYQRPGPEFAVASDGRPHCWDYCNAHPPCDFVIFYPANPYTGTGTCWLYPGETFDASKGSSDCTNPYLSVYSKPVCTGSATTTADACAATATPSPIASVCGYPPPDDCFYTCVASSGASHCLSLCAEADSCSYVVFNPRNPSLSPYASGTCWIYSNGTFDAGLATECTGAPEQFVYDNVCPKPSPSSSSLSSSVMELSSGTGSAGTTPGATTSAVMELSNGTETVSENSAPAGRSLSNPLAIGVAMLIWQAL